MTKLTTTNNYITPHHEADPSSSSYRKFPVAQTSLPTRASGEQQPRRPERVPADADTSPDHKADTFLTHHILHDDLNVLVADFDRMSDHDPSSGDGDEEPASPEVAAYPDKTTQWNAPAVGIRPPLPQPASRNTAKPMSGNTASNKAVQSQPKEGRKVIGQAKTTLPTEKVFPVQVGSDIFRLSGASISSDAPSYFTQFFEEQIRQNEETGGVRTLYIDRDPETFRDIARHLQGYYVKPRDGPHFVRLFADAQFYSLPRLISQLFESEIFIQIGEQHFQIPKDIFSDPGNSPNYFSLGFAVFFSTPRDVFPGLDRRGLLRPPPINPPYVATRSARVFGELLHLLRGYPLHIRDETHRAELLQDCRYFHLRGLEQRLIAHDISYNLERQKTEICMRLNDLKPSGISFRADESDGAAPVPQVESGWVHYARPFVDEASYEMIVEIGGESTILDIDEMRVDFHGKTKARVASLFQVVANKMNLPSNQPLGLIMLSGGTAKRSPSPGHSPLSEDRVRVRFETVADVVLDNAPLELDWASDQGRHMLTGSVTRIAIDDDNDDSSSPTDESSPATQPPQRSTSKNAAAPSKGSRSLPRSQSSQAVSLPQPSKKRKIEPSPTRFGRWTIKNGQWRLRVEPSTNAARGKFEIVFVAVKVDAYTNERARNVRRNFLS